MTMHDDLLAKLSGAVRDLTPREALLAHEILRNIDVNLPTTAPKRVQSVIFWCHQLMSDHALVEARTMHDLGVDLDDARESPTIAEHLRAQIAAWNAEGPAQSPGRGLHDQPDDPAL